MLNFAHHLKTRVISIQPKMALSRRLGGIIKGIPVEQAVKVIKTIVILRLLYGSEIWWKGMKMEQGKRVKSA